jgi:UDP-N-acetylglucosamine:LPS N-acetylglucosamine transferase
MALFLKHHVGIQEGPSLCARKLAANEAAEVLNDHELTNEDLLAYVGERTAAEERKAAARRSTPTRRRPDPAQVATPWRR